MSDSSAGCRGSSCPSGLQVTVKTRFRQVTVGLTLQLEIARGIALDSAPFSMMVVFRDVALRAFRSVSLSKSAARSARRSTRRSDDS